MLTPGLAFLAFTLTSVSAFAQAPLHWVGDGFACVDAFERCSGDPPMCSDPSTTCEAFPTRAGGPGYFCVDQAMDVLCCGSHADCPMGRCVGGFGMRSLCVLDDEHVCSGSPSREALDACWTVYDAGSDAEIYVDRYGDGDCDDDGILNLQDACQCTDGMGEPDGCPPVVDAGMADAGSTDAGNLPDAAPVDDGGTGVPDAGVGEDGGGDAMTNFRGEGGCVCRATAGADLGGGAVVAALTLLLLVRRRS